MIRVLLADDQALVRGGFRSLLDARDDIEVVGEATNGHDAVSLAKKLRPDVVLMDIRMPDLDGLEATRQIAADPRLGGVRVTQAEPVGRAGEFLQRPGQPPRLQDGQRDR
ncbi:MAG: response regulator transcription factor, partial [Acidimicrobiales bacterium]